MGNGMKKNSITEDSEFPIRLDLHAASKYEKEELFRVLGVTINGNSRSKASELETKYGRNVITHEKPDSTFNRLAKAFVNPITMILFVLVVISIFTDIIYADQKSFRTIILIFSMVFLSGMLRFVQENRSNKAAEKLKAMVHTTALVERAEEGKVDIPLSDIVPGDVIHLSAGDIIPADLRFIAAKDLFIDQATLTGESETVEKNNEASQKETRNQFELIKIGFMGSHVVSGTAIGVVVATGDQTCFGSVARGITGKCGPTSFNKGINAVSWVLVRFIIAMDILCTDKTGTITQNRVILECHLNIRGEEDPRVLRHAFLNSYYQTGLKNLMDIAILSHAKEKAISSEIDNYTKIDEIPFDFNRRRMSVIIKDSGGKTQMITKGAVEEMHCISSTAEYNVRSMDLTPEIKAEIFQHLRLAAAGYICRLAVGKAFQKGRNFTKWYIFSMLLFPAALFAAYRLKDRRL